MRSGSHLINATVAFFVFHLVNGSYVMAAESSPSVKVFFATNRVEDKKTRYGIDRNFGSTDHGLIYGTANVNDPSKKKKALVSADSAIQSVPFYTALKAAKESSKTGEVAVFVHGYNNGFDDAIRSGARLSAQLDIPVVVFDWCSRHKTGAYTVDECNVEWSSRHFQLFMQRLEKELSATQEGSATTVSSSQTKVLPISLVSHSMGNRLVYWYLQSRYDKKTNTASSEAPAAESNSEKELVPFKEVVLTSPDVDRATFRNYFFKLAGNAKQTRIYVSAHDKPLLLSKYVHLYSRLGDGRADSDENAKWEQPGAIAGTEIINFTVMDKKNGGFMGHHIPFPVIASMHKTDSPGENLELVADANRKNYKVLQVKQVVSTKKTK